jgi:hypothetical protein
VVSNGTLVAAGFGNGAVSAAQSVTVGATSPNTATLIASGLSNAVAIQDRGTLSPGASSSGNNEVVGTFTSGSISLAAGSTFTFQFLGGLHAVNTTTGIVTSGDQAAQLENVMSGSWDLLTANTLNLLNADSTHQITLKVVSMSDPSNQGVNPGSPGTSTNYGTSLAFDPNGVSGSQAMHWLFATTSGINLNGTPLTGNVNDYFQIDSSQVSTAGNTPLAGSFYITRVDNDLYLNYSAVPEPGSLLLLGIAGLGFAAYERRKRRKAAEFSEQATATLDRDDALVDLSIVD